MHCGEKWNKIWGTEWHYQLWSLWYFWKSVCNPYTELSHFSSFARWNYVKGHPQPVSPSLHSGCSGPLGMEGGIISNQQITASSTHRALFGLQKWYPYFARLNKKGLVNAWTAAENDRWPWIQVKHSHRTGDTQGRARARTRHNLNYIWYETQSLL